MRPFLLHLAQVDSTQAFLGRHPELLRCAVCAGAQTAGRGRGANTWESAPGAGLWMSAALPMPEVPPGLVPQRAMEAVIEALEPCGLELGLKWPNDLVARQEGRLVKLGGVLGEMRSGRVLLGLGVNLRSAPGIPGRAIPPACLAELGAAWVPEPGTLARLVLDLWDDLSVTRPPAFRWPGDGERIAWEEEAGSVQGRCLGWEEDGRLRVETPQGVRRLSAGDLRGLG